MNETLSRIFTVIDIEPDPEILGSEGQAAITDLANLAYWIVSILALVYVLISAVKWSGAASKPNEAAKHRAATFTSAALLAVIAGFGFWTGIITGIFT